MSAAAGVAQRAPALRQEHEGLFADRAAPAAVVVERRVGQRAAAECAARARRPRGARRVDDDVEAAELLPHTRQSAAQRAGIARVGGHAQPVEPLETGLRPRDPALLPALRAEVVEDGAPQVPGADDGDHGHGAIVAKRRV